MKIHYSEDPLYFYVEDVFDDKTADDMFKELLTNKDAFTEATLQGNQIIKEKRSNTVFHIDYSSKFNNRGDSVILSNIDKLLSNNSDIRNAVVSSKFPLTQLTDTDTHETQISRYGDEGQQYGWHIDSWDKTRMITFVYYFKDKGNWSGGEVELTNSPYDGESLIAKNPKIFKIKPKPNSLLVFSGYTPHRVSMTISSTNFEDGRFSANIWIGKK